MLSDFYGNKLTTTTGLARDNYDVGLKAFLSANYGAEEAFSLAVEADPNFSLAYAGLVRAHMSAGDLQAATSALKTAKKMLNGATEREKSHVHCFDLLTSGKSKEARKAVYKHALQWPRDALVAQINTSVFGLIGFSGQTGREKNLVDFTEILLPHYGDDWWMMSMHAISLCETGQTFASMELMEKSLSINPRNANAAHFFAHILYEEDEVVAGRDYLQAWMPAYDRRSILHGHLSWHEALWALQDGDEAKMWETIDNAVSPENGTSLPLNALTDTAAIYYRAELAGYKVDAKRWSSLSEYAVQNFPNMGQSFADVHAALSHAMAGNDEYLQKYIDGGNGFAGDIIPCIAKAWKAITQGKWLIAAQEFASTIDGFERFGGSRAQRDLLEFTYVNVLLRAGDTKKAKNVLLKRRPQFSQTAPIKLLSYL
ncbi:tetratricopeptide repeat protein [Rhodobacteraceae bacterium]|nr:tetratricopeptide repeat protein [Paracoccaceae bacterium]